MCDENLKVGSNVIVKYEGEYFPGRVENKDKGCYEISTMVLSTNNSDGQKKRIKFGIELI